MILVPQPWSNETTQRTLYTYLIRYLLCATSTEQACRHTYIHITLGVWPRALFSGSLVLLVSYWMLASLWNKLYIGDESHAHRMCSCIMSLHWAHIIGCFLLICRTLCPFQWAQLVAWRYLDRGQMSFQKKISWTNHIAELSVKFCLKKSKYTLWFQTEEIIFFLIFLTNFLFFARKSKKEFI